MISCITCGVEIRTDNYRYKRQRKYCSDKCQRAFYKYTDIVPVPTGTSGAISELVVAVDLLKNGYEVYRALSPSSSQDLVALKDGKAYGIEVRTGVRLKQGNLQYGKDNIRAEYLAVVIKNENYKTVYQPQLMGASPE